MRINTKTRAGSPANRKTMLFYMQPEQRMALKIFAAQHEISVQELIRLALNDYVTRKGAKAVFA